MGTDDILAAIDQEDARIALETSDGTTHELPVELSGLLADILRRALQGDGIDIIATPDEVTDVTAANMLGLDRPGLLRLAARHGLPSRMRNGVRRFRTEDVHALLVRRGELREETYNMLREDMLRYGA